MKFTNGGFTIDGHKGTWSIIAMTYNRGRQLFLMEHERYGDEAAYIIIDNKGDLVLENSHNGFSDLDDVEDDDLHLSTCQCSGCRELQEQFDDYEADRRLMGLD